ncbi:dTDP-4-dehydrorhamnose reductase [Sphingobacterium kyonggiense]|uniref:dTDP-4-dehydrorhamnose reductase n=1 Tax=Sphingobacterium kyonggiense TaxID=714075 RepID=A0ABP7Z4X9_9SPHI
MDQCKKRVLITGADGQLGSELRDIWLSDALFEVIFVNRETLPLDELDKVYERVLFHKADYIIHAAAYTAVDKAESEPQQADLINHLASVEIAKAAKDGNAKLIFISTDYVFQGNSAIPLSEDNPTNPINVYGESKLAAELGIQAILPQAIIIRTSWVYSIYGKNFVKTMIQLMKMKHEIQVVADQEGSPTYAMDLAMALKDIIVSGIWAGGIYHYSNEGKTTWFGFAEEIRRLANLSCRINPVSTSDFPTAAKRPAFSLLSKEKIKHTFKLAIPDWQNSLKEMLLKLENHP